MSICQRLLSGVLLAICCIVSFSHAGKDKEEKVEKLIVIHCVNSKNVENLQEKHLAKVTSERSEPGWFTSVKNKDKSKNRFKSEEDRYQNSDTSYFLSSGEVEGFQLSEAEKKQTFAVTPVALLKEQRSCRVKNTSEKQIRFKEVISQFSRSNYYWQVYQHEPRKTLAEAAKYVMARPPIKKRKNNTAEKIGKTHFTKLISDKQGYKGGTYINHFSVDWSFGDFLDSWIINPNNPDFIVGYLDKYNWNDKFFGLSQNCEIGSIIIHRGGHKHHALVIIEPSLKYALIIETRPEADKALEELSSKREKKRDIEKINLMNFEKHSSEPPVFGRQESTLTTASSPQDILVSNDPLFPHSYAHSSTLSVPSYSNVSSGYVSVNFSDLSLSTEMMDMSVHEPHALYRPRSVDDSKIPVISCGTIGHTKLKAGQKVKRTRSFNSVSKKSSPPIIVEDEATPSVWLYQTITLPGNQKETAI